MENEWVRVQAAPSNPGSPPACPAVAAHSLPFLFASVCMLHLSGMHQSRRQISVPPGGVPNQLEVWHLFSTACCYIFQIAEYLNIISLIASRDL